jgi:hypothetical protein
VAPFSRFSRAHALLVVAATLVAALAKQPSVIALVSAGSFAVLLLRTRGKWTAAGGFGLANAITSLRLVLTLAALVAGSWAPGWALALNALVVVSLDGVDGWAARRFATQGDFGGRYDTAVDSLFAYVLVLVVFPSEREAKRSFLGATVFVALVSTLGAAFVLPPPLAAALVGITIAAQSASFLWSFWEVYGRA